MGSVDMNIFAEKLVSKYFKCNSVKEAFTSTLRESNLSKDEEEKIRLSFLKILH